MYKKKSELDLKIELLIMEYQMMKSFSELSLFKRNSDTKKLIGEKLAEIDPYGEEDWND